MTKFYPEEGGFRYEAQASTFQYQLDDPDVEKIRMEWLDEYLRDNGLCRNGYTIIERRPIVISNNLIATLHRIDYRGRCKT